jgi:hypothetical protein
VQGHPDIIMHRFESSAEVPVQAAPAPPNPPFAAALSAVQLLIQNHCATVIPERGRFGCVMVTKFRYELLDEMANQAEVSDVTIPYTFTQTCCMWCIYPAK